MGNGPSTRRVCRDFETHHTLATAWWVSKSRPTLLPGQMLHQRRQRIGQLVAWHVVHQILADIRFRSCLPFDEDMSRVHHLAINALPARLQANGSSLVQA